jgi:hypothetical protein
MANKKTDMSKLRQMLRLFAQGESKLRISELTGVSRNTLKKYLKIYTHLGLNLQAIEGHNDQELDHLFGENLLPEPSDKYKTLESFFPTMEKELKKRGITRKYCGEDTLQCILMVTEYHSSNIIISNGLGTVNRSCTSSILPGTRCILIMLEKNFIL